MKIRPQPAILVGALFLWLGFHLSARTGQTSALSGINHGDETISSQTPSRETPARTFRAPPGGEAHHAAPADIAARQPPLHPDRTDAAPSPDEMAVQVLGEFGHLHLTAAQFARLATIQQAWIGMRCDLAASMARHETRDKGDVADLSLIDRARDSEVRRIVGEETFRLWLATRDVHHRAFQSDPQTQGLDERRIAQIYAAIREHDLATTTLPSAGPTRPFSDQSGDRRVPGDTRALQVAQSEVTLGDLLGRAPFARMQREGLFGLPDLTLPPYDSSQPAPAHPPPSYFPGSQNP